MANQPSGLSKTAIDDFLATAVIARLATVKPDGAPYVVPIWQHWDGEAMWVIPRGKSAFVENIRHEPRVCVSCADDVNPAHTRVTIEGTAEIVEGPAPLVGRLKEIGEEMAVRYMGPDGPKYAGRTANRPRYLVKITPNRITSWQGSEWHRRYIDTDD